MSIEVIVRSLRASDGGSILSRYRMFLATVCPDSGFPFCGRFPFEAPTIRLLKAVCPARATAVILKDALAGC